MEALQNPKCLKHPKEVSLPMWIKTVMVLNLDTPKEVPLNYNGEHWHRVSSCSPCFGRVPQFISIWCIALALNKQMSRICVVYVTRRQIQYQINSSGSSARLWLYLPAFCWLTRVIQCWVTHALFTHLRMTLCHILMWKPRAVRDLFLFCLVNQRCSTSKWDSLLLETEAWFSE